jgi:KDO2-lipid IV(A) lauroyltransferase
MPEEKIACKQRIEYHLFQLLIQAVRFSPGWARSWERRFFVFFLKRFDPKHSRIISNNLRIVFPGKSAEDLIRIQNAVYRHFVSILLEIIRTFARNEMASILERSTIRNAERLTNALKKNSGLLVISAHFGNWEWIPLLLSHHLGGPVYSIARPMDNPLMEKKVSEFRTACGSTIIHKQGSLRKILSLLGKNRVVYMLADLNTVQREAIFVDFFSRPAATGTTAARLHFKKHVPVIPLFLHYEGERIVLDVLEEIDFPETGDLKNDVSLFTRRINVFIEEAIRKNPEQWFWFHNRWKTQP